MQIIEKRLGFELKMPDSIMPVLNQTMALPPPYNYPSQDLVCFWRRVVVKCTHKGKVFHSAQVISNAAGRFIEEGIKNKAKGMGAKYMGTEGDLTLGGGHTMQAIDHGPQTRILETHIV